MKFQSSECQDLCKKQRGFGESKSLIIRTAFQIQNMSPSLLENKWIVGRMIWRILEHIISPIVKPNFTFS
jgi:hypothetical protein